MAENMIIPIESRSFAYEQAIGFFRCSYESYDYSFALTAGQTYTVTWDGTPFVLEAFESVFDGDNIIAIGNEAYITGQSATPTEPFAFIYGTSVKVTTIAALDTEPAHTFGLSLGEQEMEPEPEDGVVLLDYKDESRTYTDVEVVRVPSTTEGEMVRYVREDLIPEPVEKTVELNFSGGVGMEVLPDLGKVFSKLLIPVPEGLESGNIAEGVTVAGIPGSHKGGGGSLEGFKGQSMVYKITSTGEITIPHKLGVKPDIIIVHASAPTSSQAKGEFVTLFAGCSQKVHDAGWAFPKNLALTTTSGGLWSTNITTTDIQTKTKSVGSTFIYAADETSFKITPPTSTAKLVTGYCFVYVDALP